MVVLVTQGSDWNPEGVQDFGPVASVIKVEGTGNRGVLKIRLHRFMGRTRG